MVWKDSPPLVTSFGVVVVPTKTSFTLIVFGSCGPSIEDLILTKTNSRLSFKGTIFDNLQSLVEFILRGITYIKTEALFGGLHTTIPSIVEIVGVAIINGATVMVCVW